MTTAVWPVTGLGDEIVVPPELCSGDGWLFGGWGLGLLAAAARADHEAAVVTDLSASFLRPVTVGSRVRIGRAVLAAGRTLTQYRLDARVDAEHVLGGVAVVASAPGSVQTPPAPVGVPSPGESPERRYLSGPGAALRSLLDVRVAQSRVDAGVAGSRVRLWVRSRVPLSGDVRLAVASDHIPYLLRRMDRTLIRASTVTASLRVLDGDVDEWILLDMTIVASGADAAVGRVDLWSGGTRLVAVAEQTVRLKRGSTDAA